MTEPQDRDWYLKEWLEFRGKLQADMVRDLAMTKGTASKLVTGSQPYKRDIVLKLITWLGIRQHELFLPPAEVMKLRRMRELVQTMVAEEQAPFVDDRAKPKSPNTSGKTS